MSSSTIEAPAIVSYDDLSPDVKAVMDRAVRTSRDQYWCDRFEQFSPQIFGVSENDVVDSDGFSCRGYNREGYDQHGFDRNGFDKEGFNSAGYNAEGLNRDGFDRYGFNKEGLDAQGRDKYKFDYNGWDQEGYDGYGSRKRANREWYAAQAAKPETEFRYDRYGDERPAVRQKVSSKS